MKSTPMLMSGPLVVPTLARLKTHSCRPMKLPDGYDIGQGATIRPAASGWVIDANPWAHNDPIACPWGTIGDQIWIRETWAPADKWDLGYDRDEAALIGYRADGQVWNCEVPDKKWLFDGWKDFAPWFHKTGGKWRPSIHMPRWASRITLEITDVSVFQVQDITEETAKREGLPINNTDPTADGSDVGWLTPAGFKNAEKGEDCDDCGMVGGKPAYVFTAREAFMWWWRHIYGPESWAENVWVWGIGFKQVTA
jgi:hypothetical protein